MGKIGYPIKKAYRIREVLRIITRSSQVRMKKIKKKKSKIKKSMITTIRA
jgi:hypothetical protein